MFSIYQKTAKDNDPEEEEGDSIVGVELEEEVEEDVGSDQEDESDDDDDWITPSNLKEAQETLGEVEIEDNAPMVACVTSDFAMQVNKFISIHSTTSLKIFSRRTFFVKLVLMSCLPMASLSKT